MPKAALTPEATVLCKPMFLSVKYCHADASTCGDGETQHFLGLHSEIPRSALSGTRIAMHAEVPRLAQVRDGPLCLCQWTLSDYDEVCAALVQHMSQRTRPCPCCGNQYASVATIQRHMKRKAEESDGGSGPPPASGCAEPRA